MTASKPEAEAAAPTKTADSESPDSLYRSDWKQPDPLVALLVILCGVLFVVLVSVFRGPR